VKPILFAAEDSGSVAALDEATGEILWRLRLQGRPKSSPIYAEGKVYFTTHVGITTIVKLNEGDIKQPGEVIAVNDIGETIHATLAVAGKQIFIRTDKELWCIGKE